MKTVTKHSAGFASPTRLHADYLEGKLKKFIGRDYQSARSYFELAIELDKKRFTRKELSDLLIESNKSLGASAATLSNAKNVAAEKSVCIFAGQQTGLFLGPMYTIYKALATVKLAQKYQGILQRPVIPCFWMATDDHDFAEINTAGFLERGGQFASVGYSPNNSTEGLPAALIRLDESIRTSIENLGAVLLDTEFKSSVLNMVEDSYRPGVDFSQAFARLFNKLMGNYGIVLVDPNFPGLKDHFREIFLDEVTNHQRNFAAFAARSEELIKSGYHAQVHKSMNNLNLFYHTPARKNIYYDGDSYSCDGQAGRFNLNSLIESISNNPGQYSPNVLLRPIAQCRVFPTLCQIVGPSELAYYAQITPLFELMEVSFPILFPRPGLTIIEPQIGKIIDRYEIDLAELRTSHEKVASEVIERLFPSDAAADIENAQNALKSAMALPGQRLQKSDPEGAQILQNYLKKVDFELTDLQKKLKSSNKKRHDDLMAQIKKAHDFVFPQNRLGERALSPIYYAGKFGDDIFRQIYEALDTDKGAHSILCL